MTNPSVVDATLDESMASLILWYSKVSPKKLGTSADLFELNLSANGMVQYPGYT
jgi:hypothetical protein